MIYLKLFWSFLKIGFTSFGGTSMLPLVASEMLGHGWMTAEEVSNIVAVAEITPGPLGLNCASFAGLRTAGVLGAISANLGVLTPTLSLCAIVAYFFYEFKESKVIERILLGVRPCSLGLIAGVVFSLAKNNYFGNGIIDYFAIIVGLMDLFFITKKYLSIASVLGMNAVLGFSYYWLIQGN